MIGPTRRWARDGRRLARVGLVVCVGLCGCAGPSSGGAQTSDAAAVASPTGGIEIVFEERDIDELRFRRYELDTDGTLRIGGGKAARDRTTDWSGTPSSADLSAILTAARAADLEHGEIVCETSSESSDDAKKPLETIIEYSSPRGKRRFDLRGVCPALTPLREAFEKAGLVRFQRQLDALPEPGVRRKL